MRSSAGRSKNDVLSRVGGGARGGAGCRGRKVSSGGGMVVLAGVGVGERKPSDGQRVVLSGR